MSQSVIIDSYAFLADLTPFKGLSPEVLNQLAQAIQPMRYRMGQVIVSREQAPAYLAILYDGQARSLGYDPTSQLPITLERLQAGALLGWVGLVRGVPCETVIASTEVIGLHLPAADFLQLLERQPALAAYFATQPSLVEVFELLNAELQRWANRQVLFHQAGVADLRGFALQLYPQVMVQTLAQPHAPHPATADCDRIWLISSAGEWQVGDRISATLPPLHPGQPLRLVGFPAAALSIPAVAAAPATPPPPTEAVPPSLPPIPYAPEQPPDADDGRGDRGRSQKKYPLVRANGTVDGALACFQMLAQCFNMPFRREVLRNVLQSQSERSHTISLQLCGAVAEMMGLQAQVVKVTPALAYRLQLPALLRWQGEPAILYEATPTTVLLGVPRVGLVRQHPDDLLLLPTTDADANPAPTVLEVLLVQPTRATPQKKFGLSWFLPALVQYRQVLVEVFMASFFVQLFGLANPLITQVIIDKVIIQNSPDTLQTLGVLLIGLALFEAVLTSLRTYLFVDTTNRIDLTLGAAIIDHLLRLPLRYFERRPVGELSTRINELENIRQFLTGTALTVVLDAVFSVIYILVMFVYSWVLALVALAMIPLFAALTAVVSPIVRRQLRTKAERNAQTQSYLVEVLSGIQTVKAQNIELDSRWKWQERYARYVSSGFQTVLTSTAAGAASSLLNKLSGLLVLWVGAYLVLQGDLTLGELIAFRIIAGYVTSPLLRITQLWQNFQETALSLERLADIIDSPVESDDLDRQNIPMPAIAGHVTYENVSFRFNPSGPYQLNNISLDFPVGSFVGIVGQSGSGKSTMMKLLPRLYPLESGQILIDGYDISKVELYSLRRQVGIVPQDTLLFEGTLQDNIALNCPDASAEAIITAARIAAAHDFIMSLPNGYNTRVGERGASLSGGQRQRIAIARTILQNPRLLILDEATSALDYDSERQVCLNLAEAFQGRTVFFITHRLTTIRNADIILMMDRGCVVEQGTHEELMALQGRYYCLYMQQDAQN